MPISTWEDFASYCNANDTAGLKITLQSDVEITNDNYEQITLFKGHFNGNNKTIKLELKYGDYVGSDKDKLEVAPFDTIENGTVENVNIIGEVYSPSIEGEKTYAAGLAIKAQGESTIENVVVDATIEAGHKVAGIVVNAYGDNTHTVVIKDCINKGSVTSTGYRTEANVGGICAYNAVGSITIDNCKNYGLISGDETMTVAGIIGALNYDNKPGTYKVTNCYNYGTIKGSDSNRYDEFQGNASEIIGKIGSAAGSGTTTNYLIHSLYALGTISADDNIYNKGYFIGSHSGTFYNNKTKEVEVILCYADEKTDVNVEGSIDALYVWQKKITE